MSGFMARATQAKEQIEGLVAIKLLDRTAYYQDALELARKNHTRVPTFSEFMRALKDDKKLYNQCVGHEFWVVNNLGIDVDGNCRIDYEKGTVEEISSKGWLALPDKQRAYAVGRDVRYNNVPMSVRFQNNAIGRVFLDLSANGFNFVALVDNGIDGILHDGSKALERLKKNLR